MKSKHAVSIGETFLILAVKDTSKAQASLWLKAVKQKQYQGQTDWHVILVLPSLLSYAYADVEQYQADWQCAVAIIMRYSRST